MTSSYKGGWDFAANPKSRKEYAIDTTEAIEVGDLMWWDKRSQVVRPASSSSLWTGTTAGSQGKLAENFVGVAASAHAANDSVVTTVRVEGRGVFRFVVTTPATFEVGDYITGSKDPAGNLLFDQQVDKGALGDPGEPTSLAREICIGRAARRYTVASGVIEMEIQGMREAGASPRQYLTS